MAKEYLRGLGGRLSIQERTADLSTTLRSGRDDKGEGGASRESGGRTETVSHHPGWAQAPDFSGRDDKGKGGASMGSSC